MPTWSGILPDLIGSCFGSAGQRCLAGSVLVAVGDRVRQDAVVDAFIRAAGELELGDGLDDTATLCPVVNPEQEKRIRAAIEHGVTEGARLRLDGRSQTVPHRPRGCFLGPTVFDDVTPEMFVGREEIFGPVVSLMRAPDLDAAITLANRSRYGNTACLFTQSGASARIVPRTHPGRDARHQCRRAGADGVLPVRRLEEFDLRLSQYAGC